MIVANMGGPTRYPNSGVVRLWAAVVLQGLVDMDLKEARSRKPVIDVKAIRAEAQEWFMSDEPQRVGSFRWICDMLELDFHKIQNMAMTREGRVKLLGLDRRRSKPKQETEEEEDEE